MKLTSDKFHLSKLSFFCCFRIGHDETCGRTFLNALHEALKSGYSCAESLVPKARSIGSIGSPVALCLKSCFFFTAPQVIAQPSSQQEKLTISNALRHVAVFDKFNDIKRINDKSLQIWKNINIFHFHIFSLSSFPKCFGQIRLRWRSDAQICPTLRSSFDGFRQGQL